MSHQQTKSATFFFISFSFQSLIYGQFFSLGPGIYQPSSGRACSSTYNCHGGSEQMKARGDTCYWLYEGCSMGNCMCDPLTHIKDIATNKCLPIRRLNETCDSSDTCMNDLICENGACKCPYAQSKQTSAFLCLRPTVKLLGERCSPRTDTCYHQPVYGGHTDSEVECNSVTNRCQCKIGYVQDRMTCRRLHIGEYGCAKDFYCEGGAVCVDERCSCPTGYRAVAHNTKCAKIGATTELPLGRKCDEIQEMGYCAHGLICHRCHEHDDKLICVRYLPALEADRAALINDSQMIKSSFILLLESLTAVLLYRCFQSFSCVNLR